MPSPFRTDRARRRLPGLVAVALALVVSTAVAACRSDSAGRPRRVVIPPGATFAAAAESLHRVRLVRSARLFAMYARLGGHQRDLKAGTYVLRPGMSWGELVDALTKGRGLVRSITIPEGWSLGSIVPQLARVLPAPPESVEAAVRDTAILRRLDVPTRTLEGYLFPETYTFAPGTSARLAVATMVQAFEARWDPAWDAQLAALTMSRHDILTLASIVEKEAVVPEERPVISAVYHNRLRRGMRLQADPTVQYALGRHVTRVLYADLEVESPYNTYRHAGLAPGPIASPGLPSIRAALFPADVPYLFFVAHPDGHHEFRTTFAEHSAAIRDMRRVRDSIARARGVLPPAGPARPARPAPRGRQAR